MDAKQLILASLNGNLQFLKSTLNDFSDADLFVRPCPGANHAAWQLGHLANSETFMLGLVSPAAVISLPDGFSQRFTPETNRSDDPVTFAPFAKKAELIALLERVRGATIAWAGSLSTADLDKPSPEKMRSWAPTVADLATGMVTHVTMHIGQFQVIRRKLGKPILF